MQKHTKVLGHPNKCSDRLHCQILNYAKASANLFFITWIILHITPKHVSEVHAHLFLYCTHLLLANFRDLWSSQTCGSVIKLRKCYKMLLFLKLQVRVKVEDYFHPAHSVIALLTWRCRLVFRDGLFVVWLNSRGGVKKWIHIRI